MADNKAEDLVELLAQLKQATERHNETLQTSELARRDESQALNRVNELQKRFDAAVAQLKKGASFHTGWSSQSKGRGEVG